MLEVGALAMRTETELILKSRRVVPGRLLEGGFAFRQPEWGEAARDLVAAWRAGGRSSPGRRRNTAICRPAAPAIASYSRHPL